MAFNYRNTPRDYYQHDNRRGGGGGPSRGQSRMRYQNNRMAGGGRGAMKGNYARVDGDGDICMGGEDEHKGGSRFAPYLKPGFNQLRGGLRRGRGRAGAGNSEQRGGAGRIIYDGQLRESQSREDRRFPDETQWHKVLIPFGRRLEKQFVLKTLSANCPVRLVPVNYHLDGNSAIFFLEDSVAAAAIKQLHQKLITPTGEKISLVVRPSSFPNGAIPDRSLDEVKTGIRRRYDPSTGTLDLSFFHRDAVLKSEGHFMPLFRQKVSQHAVEAMEASVRNLVVLNMNGNKLKSLDYFAPFISNQRTLKTLLLADNLLIKISELERLNESSIEELALKNNPVLKTFHDRTLLVERLRKIFPKLRRLDGETLPPIISFDLESTTTVPESQGSFFVNDTGRDIAIQFLKQYFTMYDSDDRKGLIDAYHETAVFSLSAHKPNWGAPLIDYNRCGRNLLRVLEPERRTRFLFHGKLDIVACLQRLPRTEHDPSSFSIDVCVAAQSIVTVTSTGVFREVVSKSGHDLRSFSRTFVLVPFGTGYNIVTDALVVTNATPEQGAKAFTTPTPTPSPLQPAKLSPSTAMAAAIDVTASVLSATSLASSTADQYAVQQQMIVAFSQQSGMSSAWSNRCLEDNNWNFDKAAECFRELNSKGSIPVEAFQL